MNVKDEMAEAGSQIVETLNTWLKFGLCHKGVTEWLPVESALITAL